MIVNPAPLLHIAFIPPETKRYSACARCILIHMCEMNYKRNTAVIRLTTENPYNQNYNVTRVSSLFKTPFFVVADPLRIHVYYRINYMQFKPSF